MGSTEGALAWGWRSTAQEAMTMDKARKPYRHCKDCHGTGIVTAHQHPQRGWECPSPHGLTPCDAPLTSTSRHVAGWGMVAFGTIKCPICFYVPVQDTRTIDEKVADFLKHESA